MDISLAEANALLEHAQSADDLRDIVRRLAVRADGALTILYSGQTAEGVWSSDVVNGLMKAGEDIRVLDNTEAFRFLDIFSPDKANRPLADALERLYGTNPRDPGTSANQFLFGTIGPDGQRVADGAWDIVSAKFAAETVGEVRTITSFAQPDRVFATSELPRVLANERVTTIEDIDRLHLANLQADRGGRAAFEAVQARSYENVGKLNVAVNYAGMPLTGDAGELLIDSRAYFTGTAVAAQPPAFTMVTRPMADRMAAPSDYAQAGMGHLETLRTPPELAQPNPASAPRSLIGRTLDGLDDSMANAWSGKTRVRLDADGLPYDDVPHDIASREQLQSYERAAAQMREFKVPALWDRKDPHSYMLFGLLDGTGNNVETDPLHATNVAKLRDSIVELKKSGVHNIDFVYKEGPGTQINPIENTIDGALGRTSLARAEDMYAELAERVNQILKADPQARISTHLEGFSRGASTVPLLARMIHERGFPDPSSAVESLDAQGNTVRSYTRYHIAPGQMPMSVGLYDPVPTGYLQDFFDRRLPPSVVSGFQVNAADEKRGLFPVDRIIPEGHSADGRFFSVTVAGAHSDVGGSYFRGGLADRSLNLMTDYRNALVGEPMFARVHETTDMRMNVVHHSTEGNTLFRSWPKIDRNTPAGEVRALAPDYAHLAQPGQVVHLPDQTPEPAGAMTRSLQAQARPVERTPHVGPPEQAGAEGLMARLARDEKTVVLPYDPEAIARARARWSALGGVAVEVGLTGYEWLQTHERAQVFKNTLGNDTAKDAAWERQYAQTAGVLVGGVAATTTAAAMGMSTGGAAALAMGEAYLFGKAFERGVDWWQNYGIVNIRSEGVDWEYKRGQWVREDLRADLVDDGREVLRKQAFAAQPDKHRELSATASAKAVELALGEVPTPRNPFVQPANDSDRHSLRTRDWVYQADTGKWMREVVLDEDHRGVANKFETIKATPERAAELSAQAVQTIDSNLRAGPAEIAARYEVGHKLYGYDHTPNPQIPRAVTIALDPDLLQASDGKHYRRDPDSGWTHDGAPADAQRTLELELTRSRLTQALDEHRQHLARIPDWAPPTPEQADRGLLRTAYRDHGIDREVQPELFEASYLAVQRTRAAAGVGPENTVTVLGTDTSGRYSPDSPILHVRNEPDGTVQIAAVTTPEDIAQALADVRARGHADDVPQPAAPERIIVAAAPQEREAREQAQREANRQGLSQEDGQHAVQAAAVAAMGGQAVPVGGVAQIAPEDAGQTKRAPEQERPAAPAVPEVAVVAALSRDAVDADRTRSERERADAERTRQVESPVREPAPAQTAVPAPEREAQKVRASAALQAVAQDADPLRLGSRGEAVGILQHRLDRLDQRGPDGERIPQTGLYGPETEHAVRQFQTMRGLPATGIADHDTREAVDRALAAQRERERAEMSRAGLDSPARSLGQDVPPSREVPELLAEARIASPALAPYRSRQDETGQEPESVARPAALPVMAAAEAKPDPALAHRAATAGDRDDPRRQAPEQDRAPAASEQVRAAAPTIVEPTHAAHGLYQRAHHALSQIEVAPGMGGLTDHERQMLGASVVAMSLSAQGWNFTGYDHVVPGSKIDPQTGRPETIFVVQGALDSPGHQRIAINVQQALSQSIEQSSAVSQTVLHAREQALEQAQQLAEQQEMDGPKGPTMRMGARTAVMGPGPQSDGGGDGGGGGG